MTRVLLSLILCSVAVLQISNERIDDRLDWASVQAVTRVSRETRRELLLDKEIRLRPQVSDNVYHTTTTPKY
jgi:hypothetical protein